MTRTKQPPPEMVAEWAAKHLRFQSCGQIGKEYGYSAIFVARLLHPDQYPPAKKDRDSR